MTTTERFTIYFDIYASNAAFCLFKLKDLVMLNHDRQAARSVGQRLKGLKCNFFFAKIMQLSESDCVAYIKNKRDKSSKAATDSLDIYTEGWGKTQGRGPTVFNSVVNVTGHPSLAFKLTSIERKIH